MTHETEIPHLNGMELDHLVLWGDLPGAGRVFSMRADGIPEQMRPVSILCLLSLPDTEITFWADARVVRQNSVQEGWVNRIYAVTDCPDLRAVPNLSDGRIRILAVKALPEGSAISNIRVY